MEFVKKFYIGEEIEPKEADIIIRKIKKMKRVPSIYCLAHIVNSKNVLEILADKELYRSIQSRKKVVLVGIASGKKNALELTRLVYNDVYKHTNNVDLGKYFKELGDYYDVL